MDVIPSHYVIINFVIKGGPPWGFRIKQRSNRVVVSKVNCGGRAAKIGLRIHDEIIAVNNLEVDKQPLTLNRESNNEIDELQSLQLTKLDFTYQLIRHTVQRQLHLTIRRFVLSPCQGDEDYECDTYCSHLEGEPCREEGKVNSNITLFLHQFMSLCLCCVSLIFPSTKKRSWYPGKRISEDERKRSETLLLFPSFPQIFYF